MQSFFVTMVEFSAEKTDCIIGTEGDVNFMLILLGTQEVTIDFGS